MQNLPPGCSASDIPGNSAVDIRRENLIGELANLLPEIDVEDERFERLADMIENSYNDGWNDALINEGIIQPY